MLMTMTMGGRLMAVAPLQRQLDVVLYLLVYGAY